MSAKEVSFLILEWYAMHKCRYQIRIQLFRTAFILTCVRTYLYCETCHRYLWLRKTVERIANWLYNSLFVSLVCRALAINWSKHSIRLRKKKDCAVFFSIAAYDCIWRAVSQFVVILQMEIKSAYGNRSEPTTRVIVLLSSQRNKVHSVSVQNHAKQSNEQDRTRLT